MHSPMADEQEKLDRETKNPIDVSNAPDDINCIDDLEDKWRKNNFCG